MTALIEPQPYRHLSRLQSAYGLAWLKLVYRAVPGDFVRACVLLAVARASAADWAGPAGIGPPARPVAGASMRAIAASLYRPFETVRRHIAALRDAGLVVQGEDEVMLAPDSAAARAYLAGQHDLFLALVGEVARFGVALPTPVEGRPHPYAQALRMALDLSLEPLERFRDVDWSWNAMMLWIAVSEMNVRHVTLDPLLSRRHAVAPTPDAERRPVPLHAAAREIAMPYPSAWRHAVKLERTGLM